MARNGKRQNFFYGACSYEAKTGTLHPIDGGIYSLDDLFTGWCEWQQNGRYCLAVVESAYLTDEIESLFMRCKGA